MLKLVVEGKERRYCILYNKRSLAISFILMLNLTSMPLKAYLTEPFPWTKEPTTETPLGCYTNSTQCTESILSFFRNQTQFLAPTQRVYAMPTLALFQVSFPSVPDQVDDPNSYVAEMPFSLFYTKHQKQQATAVAKRQSNVSDFQAGGLYQVFGYTVSIFAFWAVEGSNDNTMHIGQAILQMSTNWLVFKFIFRLCLSAYIVRCMWKKYYRHYTHLENNLRLFGIKDAPKVTTIEIVIGDPTSIILLNPVVSALFAIDFWISIDFVSKAFYHVAQLVGIKEFFLAYLYLSRTLWFAYGTLSIVSHILKKLHCERYFYGVDPTWTAIAVATITGPFTYLQSRIKIFVQIYQYLFTIVAIDKDAIEASLPAAFFVFTIGTLPIIVGFLPRHKFNLKWIKSRRRKESIHISPSSYLNNGIKSRLLLKMTLYSFRHTPILSAGGSIYKLFENNCKFKKHLGLSQRDSDCYIKWKSGPNQWSCSRLSLMACIDLQTPLQLEYATQPCAFGRIELSPSSIKVIQGSNSSPWLL